MTVYSSYGTKLYESATSGSLVAFAGVTKLDPPTINNALVDSTTLDSAAREQIPSGLISVDDLKVTAAMDSADFTKVSGWCTSGCAIGMQVLFPSTKTMSFTGYISSFKPSSADAKSIDLSSVEMTIGVTGSVTIA